MNRLSAALLDTATSWFKPTLVKKKDRQVQIPDLCTEQLRREFQTLIENNHLQVLYQPIVNLQKTSLLGWEALTRGPADSYFSSPLNLFSFAEKSGMLYLLERTCRRLALNGAATLGRDQKLFINMDPQVLNDPYFVKGETKLVLDALDLHPSNIVFEITERRSIQDFSAFRKSLEHYRSQGYLIAIDDAGAGYSSLQSIAELRPDFIKLDMSLIRGVDKDHVKQALLETFVTFSNKIGCLIVAEGIETEAELETITRLGVPLGQGFYLGRPDVPPPEFRAEIMTAV